MSSYRDVSRTNYGPRGEVGPREIEVGCFQRIADATEKMTARYDELVGSRDRFKQRCEDLVRTNLGLRRRISAYKATVTRMKRKAAVARGEAPHGATR